MLTLNVQKNNICGVVGNGVIGSAIASYLMKQGYQVIVYDKNENAFSDIDEKLFYRMRSIKHLIANSDIVFSSTGRDITEGLNLFDLVKKDTTLISCSSEDKEFNNFLRSVARESRVIPDTLATFRCWTDNHAKITVLSGGYPINFDRSVRSVEANEIEITRAALLGGVIQAILEAHRPIADGYTVNLSTLRALDPYLQQFIFSRWSTKQPVKKYAVELSESFHDISWIIKNSGGVFRENAFFKATDETENTNAHQVFLSPQR